MAPTNILMVLVFASCNVSLKDLAHIADKIMVVASPSISKVHVPLRVATEIEVHCLEVRSKSYNSGKVSYPPSLTFANR